MSAERDSLFEAFLALKLKCKRKDKETGVEKPYILSLVAGKKNTSPEGFGKGLDVSALHRRVSQDPFT